VVASAEDFFMVRSFADWLCNLLVWGAVFTFVALVYEVFFAKGFLLSQANALAGLVAVAVVAVLSILWPKY
jgi:hypothetical protein